MQNIIHYEKRKLDDASVIFIVVNIDSLKHSIKEVYENISDTSWINQFSDSYVKNSLLVRASKTIEYLENIFNDDSSLSSSIGEYIVSVNSRNAIINKLKYTDIPLGELIKERKVGNGGFDYFSENTMEKYIIFGEAKFKKGKSGYKNAILQIIKFIDDGKDVSDVLDIEKFVSSKSLENMNNGIKGFSAGFSFVGRENELIDLLLKEEQFSKLLKYKELILVGVKFDEK